MKGFKEAFEDTRGFIFDFDNIIVDSECYHYLAYAKAFAEFGVEVDEEEYYRLFTSQGVGAEGYVERYSLDVDPAKVVKIKQPLFSSYCRSGRIKPFEEALDLVRLIRKSGGKYCVASNSRKRDIEPILAFHEIEELFPVVIGYEDIKRRKPDPEIFLLAAARLGLDPSRCMVFEDAEKGLVAAGRAGMRCVIVKGRYTAGISFDDADFVFDSHRDLLGEVERIVGPLLSPDRARIVRKPTSREAS